MYLDTSDPIHGSDLNARVGKVRASVCVDRSGVKYFNPITLDGLQILLVEVLHLPEVGKE